MQHLQTLREQMQDALTAATTQVTVLQEQVSGQLEAIREKDRLMGKSERKVSDLEAVFAGMQVKYEGWVERVKEAEDRESELVREIQGLKAELSKRPRPVSVPETRENVELQGYFETWLQSQPFAPQ
jgi:chromosome segregation ATPase